MSPNLPFNLSTRGPSSPSMRPSTPPRAGNFSSKLQQHKDREAAGVSISQIMRKKASAQASKQSGPSTSISHPGRSGGLSDNADLDAKIEAGRDVVREKAAQKRALEKKAKEEAKKKGGLLGTKFGSGFRKIKFHKAVGKVLRGNKNRKYFEETVGGYLRKKAAGSKFGLRDREKLKNKFEEARKSKTISSSDKKKFKGIVGEL